MSLNIKQKDYEIIFGIHQIVELIKAKKRKLIALYTTKQKPQEWKKIGSILPVYPVSIHHVDRALLTRMAETSDHQGIVALVRPFVFYSNPFDSKKHPLIVVLDGIQDPRNLGAIIRSAYCSGASGILLYKKQSAPLTAIALKASAGFAEHMLIRVVNSIEVAIQELKQMGYTIYISAFQGEDVRTCAFTKPCCIVIGSEGSGIMPQWHKVGIPITIPQIKFDISYNASVAAGILLFLAGSKNKVI